MKKGAVLLLISLLVLVLSSFPVFAAEASRDAPAGYAIYGVRFYTSNSDNRIRSGYYIARKLEGCYLGETVIEGRAEGVTLFAPFGYLITTIGGECDEDGDDSCDFSVLNFRTLPLPEGCSFGASTSSGSCRHGCEKTRSAPEGHYITGIEASISGGDMGDIHLRSRLLVTDLDNHEGLCNSNQYAWGNFDDDNSTLFDNCCGDDAEDEGTLSTELEGLTEDGFGKYICAKSTFGDWQWNHVKNPPELEGIIGDVFTIQNSYEIVSTGEKWVACDTNSSTPSFDSQFGEIITEGAVTIAGNHYLCYNNGTADAFAECIGDGTSNNANLESYGIFKRTGEGVTLSDGSFRFCSFNREWAGDLDSTDGSTCESDIGFNFRWTGSKCCGDDIDDTYNDLGWENNPKSIGYTIGGCINNLKVDTGKRIFDSNLVTGGDFEETLASWEILSGSPNIIAGLTSNQLDLIVLSGIGEEVSQEVTRLIIPGKEYMLSAYAKAAAQGTRAVISVYVDNTEIPESRIIAEDYFLALPSSSTFIIPETAEKIEVRARLTSSVGEVFIDNIKLNFAQKNIMNLNGSFYGCALNETEITSYKEKDQAGNIVGDLIPESKNYEACEVLDDYFCSESFGWETPPTINGQSRDTSKSTPINYQPSSTSCCPADYCWNSTACVRSEVTANEEFLISPIRIDDTTLYLCQEGKWTLSSKKITWDKKDTGYCIEPTQCLVDINGDVFSNNNPSEYKGPNNPTNPQCIKSGQFIEDHYCDNGQWSTRTKQLSLELLKIVDNRGDRTDFTIICDNYLSALNKYDYLTSAGKNIKEYIAGDYTLVHGIPFYQCPSLEYEAPCVNNFCILRYIEDGETNIIGSASLNQPIETPILSFLEALDKSATYCTELVDSETNFTKCRNDDTIWYSDNLNSVIFSPKGIDLEPMSFWESFFNILANPIQSLINVLNPTAAGIPLIYEAQDYNIIYANVKDSKKIIGILEAGARNHFLAINYTGFNQDICKAIDKYDVTKFNNQSAIVCNQTGNQFNVYTQGTSALSMWQDLTTKTRI